jgi:hypothetical protein
MEIIVSSIIVAAVGIVVFSVWDLIIGLRK